MLTELKVEDHFDKLSEPDPALCSDLFLLGGFLLPGEFLHLLDLIEGILT